MKKGLAIGAIIGYIMGSICRLFLLGVKGIIGLFTVKDDK